MLELFAFGIGGGYFYAHKDYTMSFISLGFGIGYLWYIGI
jgi:hypothetical protein